MSKKQLLFLAIFLLALFPAAADTIILQNGRTVEGTIVAQDAKAVRIRTKQGEILIQKTQIKRITYSDAEAKRTEQEKAEKLRREEEEKHRAEKEAAERTEIEKLRAENDDLKERLTRIETERKDAEARMRDRSDRAGLPSVFRSIAVPGWGQYYRGDRLRGSILMASAGLTAYTAFRFNRQYLHAREEFSRAESFAVLSLAPGTAGPIYGAFLHANIHRNTMHRAALRLNFSLAVLSTLYLYSAGDAFLYRSEQPALAQDDAFRIAYSQRF